MVRSEGLGERGGGEGEEGRESVRISALFLSQEEKKKLKTSPPTRPPPKKKSHAKLFKSHNRDPKSGRRVSEVKHLHSAQITSVSVSVDGATLLTCGRDSALRVTDARSLRPKTASAATGPSSGPSSPGLSSAAPCPPMTDPEFVVTSVWCSAALGPDAKHAAAASGGGGGSGGGGALFVWETSTGKRVRRLASSPSPSGSSSSAAAAASGALAVAWSPQGSPLACCDRGGGVSLWVPREEAR